MRVRVSKNEWVKSVCGECRQMGDVSLRVCGGAAQMESTQKIRQKLESTRAHENARQDVLRHKPSEGSDMCNCNTWAAIAAGGSGNGAFASLAAPTPPPAPPPPPPTVLVPAAVAAAAGAVAVALSVTAPVPPVALAPFPPAVTAETAAADDDTDGCGTKPGE